MSINPPVTHEQFAKLFAENHQRIFRFVRTLIPHRADAEDVFQETSVVLWREMSSYDPNRDFLPWALGVAFNQVRSYRHRVRRNRLVFNEPLIAELAAEESRVADDLDARTQALQQCLDQLTQQDGEIITAYYEDRNTAEKVANLLGRPVNTVYKALQRIRRRLFDCIERRLALKAR